MKKYLDQIFYEGLGAITYYKVELALKKITNKELSNLLINISKIIYFIIVVTIACYLLYYQLP